MPGNLLSFFWWVDAGLEASFCKRIMIVLDRTRPLSFLGVQAAERWRSWRTGERLLIKPFTARELLARVAAHISMRRRRVDAERALRESQATLQSFYDSSPFLMGVIEIENDNIVAIYCNSAAVDFLGTTEETVPLQTGEELGIPREIDALWIKHYRQSRREGHSVRFEYQHPRPGRLLGSVRA